MKIRLGFVSNSSSTSYIIALRRDYHFSVEEVDRILASHNRWIDEDEIIKKEDAPAALHEALEALCSESYLCDWHDGESGLPALVAEIVTVLKDKILLTTIEGAADGPTTYVNIWSDQNRDKLKKCEEIQSNKNATTEKIKKLAEIHKNED